MNRINREIKTVNKMIALYCRKKHKCKNLCNDCFQLREYADLRLLKCRYGNFKPTCSKCKIHCYLPEMRAKIIEVMRFSGPRMFFYHLVFSLKHTYHSIISK